MEQGSSDEQRSTLYLDIDGVILPYFHEDTYFSHDNPNYGLQRRWINEHEFYHPEVVQALGEVALSSLVALASSRMATFLHQAEYSELIEVLRLQGALFIDHHQPSSIEHKMDAVLRHWQRQDVSADAVFERGLAHTRAGRRLGAEGVRAAWVDDHIPQLSFASAREIATEGSIGLIAPQSSVGLTLEDVARLVTLLD